MDDAWTAYENGWLLAENDGILDMGEGEPPRCPADETVDCLGGILLPGFVNVHTHLAMIPFRSMGDDCYDRLRRLLFPLENKAMTADLVEHASRYAMGEMLKAGVTTMLDMYYFEEAVQRAAQDMGVRVFAGQTVLSAPAPDAPHPNGGQARYAALAEHEAEHPMGQGRCVVAPHGTKTVDAPTLAACHALAERYGSLMTLHACEMDDEMAYFADRGQTPIAYLKELGVLSGRTLLAHCIHMTSGDIDILREAGCAVAHCVGANMKSAKGIAPVWDMVKAGIAVGLGTDGPSSGNTLDLFCQMRMMAAAQKTRYRDRTLFPAREVVRMATRGGADILARAGGKGRPFGQLRPGYAADFQVVSLDAMHMFPAYNPYSALVYQAQASDVRHVVAGGRRLVKDGCLTQQRESELKSSLQCRMGDFLRAAQEFAEWM